MGDFVDDRRYLMRHLTNDKSDDDEDVLYDDSPTDVKDKLLKRRTGVEPVTDSLIAYLKERNKNVIKPFVRTERVE